MKKLNPDDWSPFWKKPSITSFGDLFPGNYDGSILEFWQAQLVGCPAHVVDLACGNGALTWICASILNAEDIKSKITGIDFADIAPFKTLERDPEQFPGIEFIGNTRIENLPFADGSIDIFVSQYGLEYSNLERTIPELGRKLSATGKLAVILHDQESAIVKGATEHLDDFRTVIDHIRLHDFAFELDRLLQKCSDLAQRNAAPEYTALMSKIRHSAAMVDNIARHHPASSPLHLYVQRLNAVFSTPQEKQTADRAHLIAAARDAFIAHVKRIEDLAAVALAAPDRARLVSLLEAEGLSVKQNHTLAYGHEENIGTAISAQR